MRISRSAWRKYQEAHRLLQDAAKAELEAYYDTLPWDTDEEQALRLLMERAAELADIYGTADATLSAGYYDETMSKLGAKVPRAEVKVPSRAYVAESVRKAARRATSGESRKVLCSGELTAHVKRAGIRTMRAAANRDKAQWAWVCIGDSCAFCRALGSNGWQPASRSVQAGNHAEHIHGNCDCQFVVRPAGADLEIEGYDPDALLDEYSDADSNGKGSKGQINSMRRADYTQEFAEKRNARRRELYALAHPHDENGTTSEQS